MYSHNRQTHLFESEGPHVRVVLWQVSEHSPLWTKTLAEHLEHAALDHNLLSLWWNPRQLCESLFQGESWSPRVDRDALKLLPSPFDRDLWI